MDNFNMHKMNAVRQAVVDVGATVIYLPTYRREGQASALGYPRGAGAWKET